MNQPSPFGFPGAGRPAPAFGAPAAAPAFGQQPPPAFGAPAQPQPPGFGQQPPPAAAPQRNFWVFVNGASVHMPEAQARQQAPTTPIMTEDQQGGWSTVAQLLGAPAAAPAQFQAPAPVQGSPFAPTAQSQPWNPAVNPAVAHHPGAPPGALQPQQSAYGAPANAAAAAPAGLFSGATNASASRSGTSMEEGDYIVRWCGAEYKQGQGNNVGKSWVIHDVEIVMSSHVPGDPVKGKCNQVGTHCSVFVTRNQSFDGNTKEIALALMPIDAQGQPRSDASFISEPELAQMLASPSPLEGVYCLIEARKKATRPTPQKPNGGEFTKISWWHCPAGADGMPNPAAVVR